MRPFYTPQNLPSPWTPSTWLHRVLPRPREVFYHHFQQAQKRLTDGKFDRSASIFAADKRGPVGLMVISGETQKRNLDLIAIRGDRRRRGLGTKLCTQLIQELQKQSIERLTASSVSSANATAVRLLETRGFTGNPTGGIRMRRPLDSALPSYQEPQGVIIRAIAPGEEDAWVTLKNACFASEEGREWTVDDFHREFTQSPIFDRSRIFVAFDKNRMVATATAWEANYGEGPVGLIHWVGTHPKCRGKGVGYAVNLRAIEQLAALGYADAWLNTARWREPAVRLYERLGFRIHRESVNYTLTLTSPTEKEHTR